MLSQMLTTALLLLVAGKASLAHGATSCMSFSEELIANTTDFNTLGALADEVELTPLMAAKDQELTFFAPTDKAFSDVGVTDAAASFVENAEALTVTMQLHVVEGVYYEADLTDGTVLTTLEGVNLTVSVSDDVISLHSPDDGPVARIVKADTSACKAVVHVVDTVMVPGELQVAQSQPILSKPEYIAQPAATCKPILEQLDDEPSLSTIKSLVNPAGRADDLSSAFVELTVFAPSDSAFDELMAGDVDVIPALIKNAEMLKNVVGVHIVEGTYTAEDLTDGLELTTRNGVPLKVSVSNDVISIHTARGGSVAKIGKSNVACASVLHLIDAVLVPGNAEEESSEELPCTTAAAVVKATPALSELLKMLEMVNLASIFADTVGEEKFTLFAPTNDAINAMPGLGEDIPTHAFRDDIPGLEKLLRLHIVKGAVRAADLKHGQMLETLSGAPLKVAIAKGVIYLRAPGGGSIAELEAKDFVACDSVVHLLNNVLLPPKPPLDGCVDAAAYIDDTAELSVLSEAMTVANLESDLDKPERAHTVFAPTNAAFVRFTGSERPVAALATDPFALASSLELHVVEGSVRAADLKDGTTLTTTLGLPLAVSVTDGVITLVGPNSGTVATLIGADVDACASVIHVIDAVLAPGDGDVTTDSKAPAPLNYPVEELDDDTAADEAAKRDLDAMLKEEAAELKAARDEHKASPRVRAAAGVLAASLVAGVGVLAAVVHRKRKENVNIIPDIPGSPGLVSAESMDSLSLDSPV